MTRTFNRAQRAVLVMLISSLSTLAVSCASKPDTGCATGGDAIANAFVLANPFYSYYFGSLESYVANNRAHFQSGGDAIRCASALSEAFLGEAVSMYDPNDLRRRDELNARLGTMGISPGPQQPTMSQQLYALGMQLSRLARTLPSAAAGDYGPLYTPTNELEKMQIAAGQMLRMMLQDPSMASIMAQIEPTAREAAQLEYRIIGQAAAKLAQ